MTGATYKYAPGSRLYYDHSTYTATQKTVLHTREQRRNWFMSPGVSSGMRAEVPDRSEQLRGPKLEPRRCVMCDYSWLCPKYIVHVDCPKCFSRQPYDFDLTEEDKEEAKQAVVQRRAAVEKVKREKMAAKSQARDLADRSSKPLVPPSTVPKAPGFYRGTSTPEALPHGAGKKMLRAALAPPELRRGGSVPY